MKEEQEDVKNNNAQEEDKIFLRAGQIYKYDGARLP